MNPRHLVQFLVWPVIVGPVIVGAGCAPAQSRSIPVSAVSVIGCTTFGNHSHAIGGRNPLATVCGDLIVLQLADRSSCGRVHMLCRVIETSAKCGHRRREFVATAKPKVSGSVLAYRPPGGCCMESDCHRFPRST